jgi:hypothetical protein
MSFTLDQVCRICGVYGGINTVYDKLCDSCNASEAKRLVKEPLGLTAFIEEMDRRDHAIFVKLRDEWVNSAD